MAPQVRELDRGHTREIPPAAAPAGREEAAPPLPAAAPAKASAWPHILGWAAVWVSLTLVLLALLIMPSMPRTARESGTQNTCHNNGTLICLALQRYLDAHGRLPPARTLAPDGTPLHSWRTLILPYLDTNEARIFTMIDLTKPWNDPANAVAFATPMPVYTCAAHRDSSGMRTHYQVVVSKSGLFRPDGSASDAEVNEAAGNTILFVHAPRDHGVHWMEPRDLDEATFVGPRWPPGVHKYGGLMLAVRGWHVEWIHEPEKASPAARRAYVTTANDGPGISP